jgi:hypothetical protein
MHGVPLRIGALVNTQVRRALCYFYFTAFNNLLGAWHFSISPEIREDNLSAMSGEASIVRFNCSMLAVGRFSSHGPVDGKGIVRSNNRAIFRGTEVC